jgi:uncharacterized repeat protein (TIGR03803 family)
MLRISTVNGAVILAATTIVTGVAGTRPASAWTLTVLHDFCAKGGCARSFSNAGLTIDAGGNLYGTRENDGKHQGGTVFKLTYNPVTASWDYTVLHNFCSRTGCADGAMPLGAPILDSAGNLYGTASKGGATNEGVAYEVTASGKYKVLFSFCPDASTCANGSQPLGLTYAGADAGQPYDGKSPLYGTAATLGTGIVYKATHRHKSWDWTAIYKFPNEFGGGCYSDAVTLDPAGNLYGATEYCGDDDRGEAFVLAKNHQGWTKVGHYSFESGFEARGGLLMDQRGDLYGLTEEGGKYNDGIAYQLVPLVDTYTIKTLHQFSFPSGSWPMAGPVRDAAGNLFGTAEGGGAGRGGAVFELTGKSYQEIYDLCAGGDCTTGSVPVPGVTIDSTGKLFGITTQGGANGNGTVFELNPQLPRR